MMRFTIFIGCCLLVTRCIVSQDCDYAGYKVTYHTDSNASSTYPTDLAGVCTNVYYSWNGLTSSISYCGSDGEVYSTSYEGADCTGTPIYTHSVYGNYANLIQRSNENVTYSVVLQCGTGNVCPYRKLRYLFPLEGADVDCSEAGKTLVEGQEYYEQASVLGICDHGQVRSDVATQTACNADGVVTANIYMGTNVNARTCDASALLSSTAHPAVGEFDFCFSSFSAVVLSVSCAVTPIDDANSGVPNEVSVPGADMLDCDYFSMTISGSFVGSSNQSYNASSTNYFPLNVCVADGVSASGGHRSQLVCDANGDVFYNQYVLSDTDCTGLPLHSFLYTDYFGIALGMGIDGVNVSISANCDTGNICEYAIVREFEDASDCSADASTVLASASEAYSERAHLVGACHVSSQTGQEAYNAAAATVCDGDSVATYQFYGAECSGNQYATIWSATPGHYTECDEGYTKNVLVSASCVTTTTTTTAVTDSTIADSTTGNIDPTTTITTSVLGGGSGGRAVVATGTGSVFVSLCVVAYIIDLFLIVIL